MTFYAVRYEYAAGSESGRNEHRPAHVDFLRQLHDRGDLAASGRLEDEDRPGALLVVRAAGIDAVTATLDDDPFWIEELVAVRDIRLWNIAFGSVGGEEDRG